MGDPTALAAATRREPGEARPVPRRQEERALARRAARLLADIDPAGGGAPVVAVLTGPGGKGGQVAGALQRRVPEGRVSRVRALRIGTAHRVALGAMGAPDLVIDATGHPAGASERLRSCFLLLGRGGRYLAPHRILPDPLGAGRPITGAVTAVDRTGAMTCVTGP